MLGIPLVTILYILVNVAYFTVMTPSQIIASPAVAIVRGDLKKFKFKEIYNFLNFKTIVACVQFARAF